MKNHAAALGGHAVDGCGEFMPSPTAAAADPTSLKCAACGCHRSFHRREADSAITPPFLDFRHPPCPKDSPFRPPAADPRVLRRGGAPPGAGDAHGGEPSWQEAVQDEIQPRTEGKNAVFFCKARLENAEVRRGGGMSRVSGWELTPGWLNYAS
ncbi:hypothetical protein DH2020_049922 [Rehmannia glutinosa]|uniref:ZF-HD dimerization-type domain-containing protein n=1 Tax=Rehmannia glutinosa TaxID=99300 RepID=A0ABR0U2M6_REHGL